jgi:hypothetical protein
MNVKSWSPTLRKEYKFGVFENKVPSRIFGPKKQEMAGRLEKNITWCFIIYMLQHIISMAKSARITWVSKPEGKRQPRKLAHRWEDNIKMNLTEIGQQNVDWTHITQDRQAGRLF